MLLSLSAFDIFYNSAYSTFCETNALEQVKVPLCFTSGGSVDGVQGVGWDVGFAVLNGWFLE